MARSQLFRTEPNPHTQSSVVAVRHLDGVTTFTLSVECATHGSTTVGGEVPNAGMVFISKVLTPVHLNFLDLGGVFPDFDPDPFGLGIEKIVPPPPYIEARLRSDGVHFVNVYLRYGIGFPFAPATSTAQQIRAAILQHPLRPIPTPEHFFFSNIYGSVRAGDVVSVELVPGDPFPWLAGSGFPNIDNAGLFIQPLGTDPDTHTSAPSSGFPSTGACTVEFAVSDEGPWTPDAAAGAALSTVSNNTTKHYAFVDIDEAIKAVRVTVDTTGTQAVISAVGQIGKRT